MECFSFGSALLWQGVLLTQSKSKMQYQEVCTLRIYDKIQIIDNRPPVFYLVIRQWSEDLFHMRIRCIRWLEQQYHIVLMATGWVGLNLGAIALPFLSLANNWSGFQMLPKFEGSVFCFPLYYLWLSFRFWSHWPNRNRSYLYLELFRCPQSLHGSLWPYIQFFSAQFWPIKGKQIRDQSLMTSRKEGGDYFDTST